MKNINFKYQIAAGVILVIGGTLALLSDYIKEKRDVVFSEMNLALSSVSGGNNEEDIQLDEDIQEEVVEEDIPDDNNDESSTDSSYEEYLGVIDIPRIGLYKGFYSKNSNLNNVKFNLYVLPESTYPDVSSGNLIIAGHSGNYNNSYFANLYQLVLDDTVIIYYNNMKYTYKIVNIYYEEKKGTVRIFRDKSKTTLTLITCTKDDSNHQTIYISELVGVE